MSASIYDALVELTDDTGADTLARYFAQIEYTASCCIQMISGLTKAVAVIPETGDDVLLDYGSYYEFQQLKTRDESVGQWLASEVIPISAEQLVKTKLLDKPCRCVFVSNAAASPSKSKENCYGFARYKLLIKISASASALTPSQSSDYKQISGAWIEALVLAIKDLDATYDVSAPHLLMEKLRYETSCIQLRAPEGYNEYNGDNLIALAAVLEKKYPGRANLSLTAVTDAYEKLLLLIIRRTIFAKQGSRRPITERCVLASCLAANTATSSGVDLSLQPGRTIAEKKAHYGGFDQTDFKHIVRQRSLGEVIVREITELHGERRANSLSAALAEFHRKHRRSVSNQSPGSREIGPHLLDKITESLEKGSQQVHELASNIDLNELLGIIWLETNECRAWWHGYGTEATL